MIPHKGGVFALGNFDGVHRGHQAVLRTAIDIASEMDTSVRVITLEPHPRTLFNPEHPPFRLTSPTDKIALLRSIGAVDVVVLNFTPQLAHMPAEEFVHTILRDQCGAHHVVAGFDYVFGHERRGTMSGLRSWLSPHGIGVTEVTPARGKDGEILSSSRVRNALQKGDLSTAETVLGRPWRIRGIVQKGAARGRTMNTPTANIALGDYLRPRFGVYAIMAKHTPSNTWYQGVANIGIRPTVDGTTELLEAHLFNFSDDIYGQEWEVEFRHFIRGEQTFPDLAALQEQIAIDIEQAKSILSHRVRS